MRTPLEKLELRFEIRRGPGTPLKERMSAIPALKQVLKDVRKLNRSIEQALEFMREDNPAIAAMVVDITVSNGRMTFFCDNDSTRHLVDGWVRSNTYNIQGVCSKPPRRMVTKCRYLPSG